MFIRGNQGGLRVGGDASKLQREGKVGAGSKWEEETALANPGGSIHERSLRLVRHCWCREGNRGAQQLRGEADTEGLLGGAPQGGPLALAGDSNALQRLQEHFKPQK